MALPVILAIIIAVLFFLWILEKKKTKKNVPALPESLRQYKNRPSAGDTISKNYAHPVDDPAVAEIHAGKQTIQELDHTIEILKSREKEHLQTISELNRSLENLKTENQRFSALLMNHRNSIPILLRVRKDNSDLLFFYRELIHTIVYYNPVHASITTFSDDLSLIDKELKRKEVATLFGNCLAQVNFINLEAQIKAFEKRVISLLYSPFRDFEGEEPSASDPFKREEFQQLISARMTRIMSLRQPDLENIEKLYHILNAHYDRWKKILSRSWIQNLLKVTWDGLKRGIIDRESEAVLGSLLQAWEHSEELSDNDFVQLYSNTVQSFINTSVDFSKNLDIDFTALEIIYQKCQEKENSLWHEKAQLWLVEGEEISGLYDSWRNIQINPSLRDYPNLLELIFDELRLKSLDESSIENIRSLVTNSYIAGTEAI